MNAVKTIAEIIKNVIQLKTGKIDLSDFYDKIEKMANEVNTNTDTEGADESLTIEIAEDKSLNIMFSVGENITEMFLRQKNCILVIKNKTKKKSPIKVKIGEHLGDIWMLNEIHAEKIEDILTIIQENADNVREIITDNESYQACLISMPIYINQGRFIVKYKIVQDDIVENKLHVINDGCVEMTQQLTQCVLLDKNTAAQIAQMLQSPYNQFIPQFDQVFTKYLAHATDEFVYITKISTEIPVKDLFTEQEEIPF